MKFVPDKGNKHDMENTLCILNLCDIEAEQEESQRIYAHIYPVLSQRLSQYCNSFSVIY